MTKDDGRHDSEDDGEAVEHKTTDDIKRGERIVAALDILLQDCDNARESAGKGMSLVHELEDVESIKAKNIAFYDEAGALWAALIAKSKISEVEARLTDLRRQAAVETDDTEIVKTEDKPPVPSHKREFEIVKVALGSGYTLEPVDVPDTELRKCDVCREEMEMEMDLKGRGAAGELDALNAGGWQYVCRKIRVPPGLVTT